MEQTLLTRIREGDIKAFETLYNDYYEKLCHFGMQLLRSRSLVEEVADDVLFYLWDHRETVVVTSLESYLLKAVRNQSINRLASAAYRNDMNTTDLMAAERASYLSSLFDEGQPLEQLLYKEMEAKFQEAIDQLSPECRDVFIKCRIEGKKYAEAAAELGISVNTVKYHLKNATALLSQALGQLMLTMILLQ